MFPFPNAVFDVVALAASAGGLTALTKVLSALPAEFPAAVVVVQHLDPRHRSLMAEIFSRRTPLKVKMAEEGDCIGPSTGYIAPPNRHLPVNPDGTLSLTQSELVHFVRPSADLLFESVASSFKDRAIAVVLTGSGSDGSMGVKAIRKMGGRGSPRTKRPRSSSACRAPRSAPAAWTSSSRWTRSPPPW